MSESTTLVLFAHPAVERARLGPMMAEAAATMPDVEVRDLYELYPDFTIDVTAEQRALKRAKRIVMQFPFYWYSTPALLKEWMDLVLTHNFAYGAKGHALEGKRLACALSTGGSDYAYVAGGPNRYSVHDFLRPIEQTARLCRMSWERPFTIHGAPILTDEDRAATVERYRRWLTRLEAKEKP
jgi:glutathione-regulated potassium-efflux system ancillary protein KefG